MADAVMGQPPNHHNVFRAIIKGVFFGFIIALLFIIASALLAGMGLTNTFLTNEAYMGLLGFFVGLGMETYPTLF